ncbi:MAG: response regulator [Burkholderiales bacterium]|nr:response regulator [Burkholderiales bacterium]
MAGDSARHAQGFAARPIDLNGVQLLLAEDNEINSEIACELLSSLGARIDVAQNGEEAVAQLLSSPDTYYQAVLMDVQMPEMDGFEATRILRAHPTFQHLPIIAMTAHASAEERARCLSAGMNDHIAKPIDPALLFDTVSRWVGRTVAATTAHHAGAPLPDVEGLDTAEGLSRTMGDALLYRDLLQRFVHEHGDTAAHIRQVCISDRETAYRTVHTLKSVAGLIGAMPLEGLAAALEHAIETGEGTQVLTTHADALAHVLGRLCAALCTFFTSDRGQSAAS